MTDLANQEPELDLLDDIAASKTATLAECQDQFLDLIRTTGASDPDAARAVGRSRWAPQRWKKDPEFKTRYDEARKISLEHLVREAERRAIHGSDRLLMFLLEHYDPVRFGRREELNLGNAGGKPLQVTTPEAAERVARLMAIAARRKAEEDEMESLL